MDQFLNVLDYIYEDKNSTKEQIKGENPFYDLDLDHKLSSISYSIFKQFLLDKTKHKDFPLMKLLARSLP